MNSWRRIKLKENGERTSRDTVGEMNGTESVFTKVCFCNRISVLNSPIVHSHKVSLREEIHGVLKAQKFLISVRLEKLQDFLLYLFTPSGLHRHVQWRALEWYPPARF